jgi:hypothetical protein
MVVCDALEAALANVQGDRGRLLEALLQEALSECTGQVTTFTGATNLALFSAQLASNSRAGRLMARA